MFYKTLFRAVSCRKLFLEEVYMLDRFAFKVFLSVYIFSPSIARMPKFRLLTKRDPTLGYTREADEIFKKNSEQQDKWTLCNLISNSPEEVNSNNLDLLD